jgi:hypothetical protein
MGLGIFEEGPEWDGTDVWVQYGPAGLSNYRLYFEKLSGSGMSEEDAARCALRALEFEFPEQQYEYIHSVMPYEPIAEDAHRDLVWGSVIGQLSLLDDTEIGQSPEQPSS